jgi:hypothetical protein
LSNVVVVVVLGFFNEVFGVTIAGSTGGVLTDPCLLAVWVPSRVDVIPIAVGRIAVALVAVAVDVEQSSSSPTISTSAHEVYNSKYDGSTNVSLVKSHTQYMAYIPGSVSAGISK